MTTVLEHANAGRNRTGLVVHRWHLIELGGDIGIDRHAAGFEEQLMRTDKLIAASVQWAEAIMRKIDNVCSG
jgi:hypothetical protein